LKLRITKPRHPRATENESGKVIAAIRILANMLIIAVLRYCIEATAAAAG